MALDNAVRERLRALFEAVELTDSPPPDEPKPSLFIHGGSGRGMLFRGDSLFLLQRLTNEIAVSALSMGGSRPEQVQSMLIKACRVSIEDGADTALLALEEELGSPPITREVIIECPMIVRYDRDFEIGAGRIVHSLPSEIGQLASPPKTPAFAVGITASDDESARIVAADRFEEAMAILALADRSPVYPIPETWMVYSDGRTSWQSQASRVSVLRAVNPPDAGQYPPLWPEYQALSEAAASSEDERSDWAARSLRAARWLRIAENALWPSLALSASMSTMECLFVRSKSEEGQKGARIADRLFGLGVALAGHTADSQREWFIDQYRARNGAVHEGISVSEELEVELVKSLARHSTKLAISHLRPFHGVPDNGVCTTFDEVFDAERHPLTGATSTDR